MLPRPLDIAFYAPMKAPDHPVPSGDREMAKLLIAALQEAGHHVSVISTLRSHRLAPDAARWADRQGVARREVDTIAAGWTRASPPDLWFTYHNYYKAPDLLGPDLTRRFGLPYVIAESSHAPRRATEWGTWAALADAATRQADLHLAFTARDRAGLAELVPPDRIVDLPPFIDAAAWPAPTPLPANDGPPTLVTIAMMRPGDKLRSYHFLADALALLVDLPWRIIVVGDGPAQAEVAAAFGKLPRERALFQGRLAADGVRAALAHADVVVWPGFGEAYGMAFLEAQAEGRPVVALDTAGVSAAVRSGETGLLVATAEPAAFAQGLRGLLEDGARRRYMGQAAARWVRQDRSLAMAARVLASAFDRLRIRGEPRRVG